MEAESTPSSYLVASTTFTLHSLLLSMPQGAVRLEGKQRGLMT